VALSLAPSESWREAGLNITTRLMGLVLAAIAV
jgi:small neutral amino acid transporter SnatA (MarC family)